MVLPLFCVHWPTQASEGGEGGDEIDALVWLSRILAECFEVGDCLIKRFPILNCREQGLVVAQSPQRLEAGENGDMLADQLEGIGALNHGGTGDADVQPSCDEIIEQVFIIYDSNQKIHNEQRRWARGDGLRLG